jgi:hypothetical protein
MLSKPFGGVYVHPCYSNDRGREWGQCMGCLAVASLSSCTWSNYYVITSYCATAFPSLWRLSQTNEIIIQPSLFHSLIHSCRPIVSILYYLYLYRLRIHPPRLSYSVSHQYSNLSTNRMASPFRSPYRNAISPPLPPPKHIDLNSSTRSTDHSTGSKVTRRAFHCDVILEAEGPGKSPSQSL